MKKLGIEMFFFRDACNGGGRGVCVCVCGGLVSCDRECSRTRIHVKQESRLPKRKTLGIGFVPKINGKFPLSSWNHSPRFIDCAQSRITCLWVDRENPGMFSFNVVNHVPSPYRMPVCVLGERVRVGGCDCRLSLRFYCTTLRNAHVTKPLGTTVIWQNL